MVQGTQSLQMQRPAADTLTSGHFQMDKNGNVVVKNDALKALLDEVPEPFDDQNLNFVVVTVR